jgi:group I intron endonuclease
MDFHPTSFFILENVQLGTFWVGQAKMVLDECGFSLLPAVTRGELVQKLETICIDYTFPSLDLVSINKNGSLPFYGVERWISKLRYKINKEPKKYKELRKLLTAGWHQDDFTDNSTLNVLHVKYERDLGELYKRLIKVWEAKGMRCLNTHTCKTRTEKYQDKKKDPEFLKTIGRKKVLMDIKKKQKLPKPSTLQKYNIQDHEIEECMGPKGIIYKIDCEISGKSYIGKMIQPLKRRIQQHRESRSYCRALSQAIKDHGWENFKFSAIWEGNASLLGEMERKLISEHGTMEPGGYNLREGGGRSEKVSDTSRKLMIEKQREVSKRRGGLLGKLCQNKLSWSLRLTRDGMTHTIGPFNTKEEAIECQKKFTEDPDDFEIPPPKRLGNGVANGIYYRKDRDKWQVSQWIDGKNVSLGVYKTNEEAKDALERYKKNPEKFVKPCDRDDKGVTFKKNENVWQCAFYDGKTNKFIGRYQTKQEAIDARNQYLEDPENFITQKQRTSPGQGGVSYKPKSGKWQVSPWIDGKNVYLGIYKTEEEAREVLAKFRENKTILE